MKRGQVHHKTYNLWKNFMFSIYFAKLCILYFNSALRKTTTKQSKTKQIKKKPETCEMGIVCCKNAR